MDRIDRERNPFNRIAAIVLWVVVVFGVLPVAVWLVHNRIL